VNLSLRALRRHVPALSGTADEIAERLRAADVAVERIVPLRELLLPIVVGRVEAVTQHPNADRLRVCVVDDGGEAPRQIVTGAANVAAGCSYPVIRAGSWLPNGTKIRNGKLRGERSEGMLGSARELELGDEQSGLMTLPGDPVPGTPLVDVVDAEGTVFVFGGDVSEAQVIRALGGEVPEEPAEEQPASPGGSSKEGDAASGDGAASDAEKPREIRTGEESATSGD
jgi:phenylalanyl-tRNA synthetase beta chain